MLVYVAGYTLSLLVAGPWRDPQGYNFPQSKIFGAAAMLPNLLSGTRLSARLPDRACSPSPSGGCS